MERKRILVFGAGVIGSIYGGLLAESGADVTLLARGKRLSELREQGLALQKVSCKEGATHEVLHPSVHLIEVLTPDDVYDYIFVTLRAEQVAEALPQLAANASPTFVFMINNAHGYTAWEQALGKGRVLPAFPGAGGSIKEGIVQYGIVQQQVQPTVLGEIDGTLSPRLYTLQRLLREAGFCTTIQRNMDAWQKTHLALVCPLACALYYDGGNNYSLANNRKALLLTGKSIRENLSFLKRAGIDITPRRVAALRFIPKGLMCDLLNNIFASRWAETFVLEHSLKARTEMLYLTEQLLDLAQQRGFALSSLQTLLGSMPLVEKNRV
ncbi:ketopantoate reductase family protein [Porphyromonas circumdentaria]|uniref:2-dehydropantoate 2-reductase n=1 Tax=Porphyromonas circumdentaria TaxID=29524 RepID=A0A1T4LWS1_9PORP|nr:2-dehydropantoate 2-reductase N-terminal domain-containing protein [Porphyromonas circumdentaria]MBB6275395.1 2-dehydropantoate 2-reductase [Porphyromonas circumdentaria]MDO4722092.1 2-dehydropantoate 2-reductase N-terminal domain-containing protein [Porphyromonas circumdentaria]SJZ59199.1 2-dehydropantoate 2-reductase [Porphyromonas circumdentaria]